MRKYLILAGALATSLLAARPAMAAHSRTTQFQYVCHFKRSAVNRAVSLMKSGESVKQVCADKSLTTAMPRSVAYGSCGESWIFNGKLGPGWTWEHYGVRIWPGIRYGTASIHWYNYSTGGSNYYSDYIYPSVLADLG